MRSMVMIAALAVQGMLALRVLARLVATAAGRRIEPQPEPTGQDEGMVCVLVPVLDEAHRLGPALAGLTAQGREVGEILVVDGGSRDATRAVVEEFAALDSRIRWIDAAPIPPGANGKAHGLAVALAHSDPASRWILTIDADVRPSAALARSLLTHARNEQLRVLSVATRQRLSGPAEGVVHPSMLATLVYRFGIPGHATANVEQVQANGQCFLVDRAVLATVGGFAPLQHANAEDVTLARTIAAMGEPVGFFEAGDLVTVEMYSGWQDAWHGWSRSLPMRDRYSTWRWGMSVAEVGLVQAAPLVLWPVLAWRAGPRHPLALLNAGLVWTRLGVLVGMHRAYERPPPTYWLSPLADLAVVFKLVIMARRRSFTWRGRDLDSGGTS